jgi:hypothetical protein
MTEMRQANPLNAPFCKRAIAYVNASLQVSKCVVPALAAFMRPARVPMT